MENCTITNIGAPVPITFPGGLVYRNGIVYTYNQSSPYQLWSVDTVTGGNSLLFNMTGVPQANLTGMLWDGTTMYGLSTSISQSQIFTINMSTGACTPLGTPSATCAGGIMLLGRLGTGSSMYALDIVADNSYRVNKTTGAFTLLGPLGQNINFGQDGSVDPNDNTIYVACYSTGPELRKWDTTSGGFGPVLCTYTAQVTGLACVANGTPPPGPQWTICRNNANIVIPNLITVRDTLRIIGNNACQITDVNIRIDTLVHTWDSDLVISITHNATTVALITNRGGSGDNFIGTILNDSASTPISGGTAPFTGSFRPETPLSVFNGQAPNGDYILTINDNVSGDTGYLKAWCIVVSFSCPVGGIQTIEIPNYYFLNQNYPNPFNPVTNIKFGIPESGDVRLVVYDILGRAVRTLMNEYKNPGTYEVQFDATELASGIYFYSLQTIKGTETKRMLMIK
jgi:hypothetical protein